MTDSIPSETTTDPSAIPELVAGWLEQRGIVGSSVLVGVSGGADSVGLLRALVACRGDLSLTLKVAHLDHGLRPASAGDAHWVAEVCRSLDVPVSIEHADVRQIATEARLGLEETARRTRYEFFRRAAGQQGCTLVAVAHTADDHAETILHHIIRGTGLAGLRGISEVRSLNSEITLIRPLRNVRRAALLAYLDELGQDFRIDESNEDERFTRNKLRHRLLPLLRADFNPQVDEALVRLARQVADVQNCLEGLADELLHAALIEREISRAVIDCRALATTPRHLVREAMCRLWVQQQWPRQRMGFEEWERIAVLVQSQRSPKAESLPHEVRVQRRGTIVEIRRSS